MIKVIVISDIKIYCEGLSRILSATYPLEVIGADNNFPDTIENIKQNVPDVILLDMTMADSCRFAENVLTINPQIKIVALGISENEENIVECAEVGITGYVAREASLDELIKTVIGTQKGEFCCPPKIAACIFKTIQRIAKNTNNGRLSNIVHNDESIISALTKREQQIIRLMAAGLSNKKISCNLTIEVSTVKNHVHNILVKLGVSNRTQAVSLLQRVSLPKIS